VTSAVNEAVALFGNRFREENIDLVLDLPAECRPVRAEEVRLEQILVNLLANAIDAVHDGERRRIAVSVESTDEIVTVEVVDSGPGIAAADTSVVFDPFYTTKEPGAGTGLGLSISYNIAKDFGGNLVAASGAAGARFTLTLPAV
jgi:C4-dicarboxylate-specific signal transduction histidine kinase